MKNINYQQITGIWHHKCAVNEGWSVCDVKHPTFHIPHYFFNDSMSYKLEENFENMHNKEYRLPSLAIMKLISF